MHAQAPCVGKCRPEKAILLLQSQVENFQGLDTHLEQLDLTLALDWFPKSHHFLAPRVTTEANGYSFSKTQLLSVHSPGCFPSPSSFLSFLVLNNLMA